MQTRFDEIRSRLGTHSIKWDVRGQVPPPAPGAALDLADPRLVLPLWVADMDFPTAEPIVAALLDRVRDGIFGYAAPSPEYFAAVAGWLRRRHAWEVDRDWILPSSGAVPSINLAIQTLTEPGEGVIVQPPVFHPFAQSIENNGRRVIVNPLLRRGDRYFMDFDDLARRAAEPGARMLVLCSPHNPVGRVWSIEELQRLARTCIERDLLIVSDEVHCDLTHSPSIFTTLAVASPECASRLVHCHGPSKTFNLQGLKASTTIIPDAALRGRFLAGLRNLNELFSVAALGTLALQTAYEQGEPWLRELLAYLEGNLRFLREWLAEHLPRLTLVPAEATYLAWIDCRALGATSAELRRRLLEEARVLVEDGSIYGEGGEGYLRMNIACPRRVLEAALVRIGDVLGPTHAGSSPAPGAPAPG